MRVTITVDAIRPEIASDLIHEVAEMVLHNVKQATCRHTSTFGYSFETKEEQHDEPYRH